ncbi:MAG: TlpA disulfide reductase family protein [Bacteroidia bacterium]|nr:TlpA disulfide reductase family protein [Bacteroidia bacterium]
MKSAITCTLILSLLTAPACKAPQSNTGTASLVTETDTARLTDMVRQSGKSYVLVNFYTTYCKPCVKEMPELLSVSHKPESPVQLILVSLDEPEVETGVVASFLQRLRVDQPTYRLGLAQAEPFIRRYYPDWDRSVPLNLLYAQDGRLVEVTGITSEKEVEMIINHDLTFGR